MIRYIVKPLIVIETSVTKQFGKVENTPLAVSVHTRNTIGQTKRADRLSPLHRDKTFFGFARRRPAYV